MNFESVHADKSYYAAPGGFSAALEAQDPSIDYKGTALEGTDAFQRQLKRFGIRVKGAGSSRLESFFQSADAAALFPEYIARAVKAGMESADILGELTACSTDIDGLDYRSLSCTPAADLTTPITEGGLLPATAITNKSTLVTMKKHGQLLTCSYESVRYHRLELFTVTLRQMGAAMARAIAADAVDVLIDGDGSAGSAAGTVAISGGSLAYTDLLALWNSFSPFTMTTMLAPADVMTSLLAMTELRDPSAGLDFNGSGKLGTPLGAKLLKCDAVPAGSLAALDRTCCLETVRSGGIVTDYDKLTDRQLDRAAVSATVGFAKIFPGAAMVLS